MDKPVEGIVPEAMRRLEAYDWPGNVRELENTMERSVALETGSSITLRVLPEKVLGYGATSDTAEVSSHGKVVIPEGGLDFEKFIADVERTHILAAIEASGGVGTRAAERLKISYRSFRHYIKKYNIT